MRRATRQHPRQRQLRKKRGTDEAKKNAKQSFCRLVSPIPFLIRDEKSLAVEPSTFERWTLRCIVLSFIANVGRNNFKRIKSIYDTRNAITS